MEKQLAEEVRNLSTVVSISLSAQGCYNEDKLDEIVDLLEEAADKLESLNS